MLAENTAMRDALLKLEGMAPHRTYQKPMKNSIRQNALTIVRALTDAAISTGEMNCDDEGYMRDLDESKVDAVLAVCGKGRSGMSLVRAVLRSQENAPKNLLRLRSPNADMSQRREKP